MSKREIRKRAVAIANEIWPDNIALLDLIAELVRINHRRCGLHKLGGTGRAA